MKILVVDDEPSIVALLKEYLEKKNHQVITACDGYEALEKVRLEKPRVVLLDISMPRKSGLEVLKEIKEYDSTIGVIMVTALADEETGRSALAMGAFDYILKPFDLKYLDKVLWWKLQLLD